MINIKILKLKSVKMALVMTLAVFPLVRTPPHPVVLPVAIVSVAHGLVTYDKFTTQLITSPV